MNQSKGLFIIGWIMACAAIAYHDMKDCHMLPRSARIMDAGLAFTMLYIMSFFSATLAGVTAGGFVLALYIKREWVGSCQPTNSTGTPSATAFLTGNPSTPSQAPPPPFTAQPPSYGNFVPAQLPTSATQQGTQPPGTTLE